MGSVPIPAIIYRRLEDDILRLKLQLPAKAGRFHIFECEAVRLVTLPDEEFQDFLNGPHQDGRWAAEPFYADEHGRRIYQGVLVLGEGHKDGVFAYDGGKHFAYLPGARAVVDSILEQAVEKIIREGAENTTLTDECFDVCYYLDYCKNLAPEQPAPSLSAERKEEIISGILNYMAEYFDDSSLYDILHNTLEICNDEIGCLGFALYDEYVDEQIEASEVQSDLLPKSGRLVNLLSAYEELQQIPDEERITRLAPGAFGYCLDPNVPDERLHTAYQQALSALELESDEIQEAESFTSRDEIISRMRDCLLAKELTAGDKVLFVATEPYGGPGDFDLRGGVIESVDEKDKTCSVRGTFFTMEKVPLHYVLGRYNPAVGEEHYGVRGIVPFFCEDKELAGYYLNEVRTMWDVEMGEEQDLSM